MFTNRPSTGSSTLPVADKPTRKGRGWRLSVTVLLSLSVLLTLGYTATSIYMSYVGMQLSLTHRMPIDTYTLLARVAVQRHYLPKPL